MGGNLDIRRRHVQRRILRLSIAAAVVVGCASTASTSPVLLSISNGTTIPVTLVVNGAVVEIVAPGGYEIP